MHLEVIVFINKKLVCGSAEVITPTGGAVTSAPPLVFGVTQLKIEEAEMAWIGSRGGLS